MRSKARFLSIMAMITLGVGFFAGINATAPNMVISADTYFKDYNLSNFRVMNPLGFNDEDLKKVQGIPELSYVMESYTKDAFLTFGENQTEVIKLFGFDEKEHEDGLLLNIPLIEEGRLPVDVGEIVLEEGIGNSGGIELGDMIEIGVPEDQKHGDFFKRKEYEVVGFITSPLYISFERGQTNIGDGSIAYYGYINEDDFNMDKVTDIFIKTKESDNLLAFSPEYEDYHQPPLDRLTQFGIDSMAKETKDLRDELSDGKQELQENKEEALEELAKAEQELIDAEQNLRDGEEELNENERKY
ncbi:MAG TPA: hypothetical protein VFD57_04755, partial [Clostridia bacterium]|nr:hypothetical protein [Clostridia bacterium]